MHKITLDCNILAKNNLVHLWATVTKMEIFDDGRIAFINEKGSTWSEESLNKYFELHDQFVY